jgi:hypothetical protein
MRFFNRYIITVAFVLLATVVVLVALGKDELWLYYSLMIIEALAVTELYAYLNTKAQRALTSVGFLLFAGFLVAVAQKVLAIIK